MYIVYVSKFRNAYTYTLIPIIGISLYIAYA